MAQIELLSKILNLDLENHELLLKIEFITPELLIQLEEFFKKQNDIKVSVKSFTIDSITDKQRKAWYASLKTILQHYEIIPSGENMDYFDRRMREKFFPIAKIDIGILDKNDAPPEPKRMKEMSMREMNRALMRLWEMYDIVNWSEFINLR